MASLLPSPSRFYFTKYGKNAKGQSSKIFSKFSNEHHDLNLKAAVNAASIRFQESLRSDPLFVDPYAGCFLSSVSSQKDMREQCPMTTAAASPCYYSLATKFIDDKLLSLVSSSEELRQIVLLTDGMDTRPYRLIWPRSSVIYDIYPGKVFKEAYQRLEDLLFTISGLAMEGCIFMGELPGLLQEAELETMCTKQESVEKLFMSYGFQVDVIEYGEIARNLQLDSPPGDQKGVPFIARQLRLSDAQMETWRARFGRLEEVGDEDGFDEL